MTTRALACGACFLFAFAVIAGLYLLRAPADWGKVYVPAAHRLAGGEELFAQGYFYPPAFAWLILPLTTLPTLAERLVWALVNAGSLLLLLAYAWRASGADQVREGRAWAVAGIAAVIAGPFLLDAVTNQQNDLVVIALVLAGCALLQGQAHLRGACLLGLAAGIKCTPLLWAPYLLWRRRFLPALLLLLVALGINLAPDVTHPPSGSAPRLLDWARRYLLPTVRDRDPGEWASAIHFNHSVAGVSNRLLTWRREDREGKVRAVPRADRVSPEVLKFVVRGILLTLLAIAALASWGPQVQNADRAGEAERHEFGLVVCLMVLLSPMSSKPHFGILILPALLLARHAVTRTDPRAICCLVAAIAGAIVSNKDLVGAPIYLVTTWYGCVALVSLVSYAGCAAALLRLRAAPHFVPADG